MTNINWGQLVNNFVNNFNKVNINNVQNNILNTEVTQSQPQINQTIQNLFPNTTQQLVQTSTQLALLTPSQTVDMVKELMNMPKNFELLLNQLSTNTSGAEKGSILSLLASSSNLSVLTSLLQNNSKEALSNLYQLLAQFNQIGVSIKEEQINELTKMINIIGASSMSETQSLKTIMLMYLPWLPLANPNSFILEIANKNSESVFDSDDSVTVMIATRNYGNIYSEIIKTSKDGIKIEFTASQIFPLKDFVVLMKEESKKYSININFELSTKESFNSKKNNSETEVFMNTSPGVNPFLLLISNALIKNVHVIDSKENLREQRKEKINNVKD